MSLTIKEALYRELKYGPILSGLVDPSHVKLDMRNTPSATKADADYPWLVFRRITSAEDNQVNYAKERIEIEIVGLRSSAAKGDDLLEQIREALINAFANQTKTWGKYTANGSADPTGGLRLKAVYMTTTEAFSQELDEKAHLLTFLFTYLRS